MARLRERARRMLMFNHFLVDALSLARCCSVVDCEWPNRGRKASLREKVYCLIEGGRPGNREEKKALRVEVLDTQS